MCRRPTLALVLTSLALLAPQPYDEYILDPTTNGDKQPVIRIWYPKGSWSPGSKYPGGMLMFVYPYKVSPNQGPQQPGKRKERNTRIRGFHAE